MAGGWSCASRDKATGSGMTPSCWRRRPMPGRASTPSILARASERPDWRWRTASRALTVTLVEIDPALVALAADNARAQWPRRAGSRGQSRCVRGAACLRGSRACCRFGAARADESAVQRCRTTLRPIPAAGWPMRRRARCSINGCALPRGCCVPNGVLTLIWRADGLPEVLAALEHDFGALAILPVHPKPGTPAIRLLVRAVKGNRAPPHCCRDWYSTTPPGKPSAEAEAVLRDSACAANDDLSLPLPRPMWVSWQNLGLGTTSRSSMARAALALRPLVPRRFRSDIPVVPVVRLHGVIGLSTPLRPGLTLSARARA